MLENEYLLANIGFDTAENVLPKARYKCLPPSNSKANP